MIGTTVTVSVNGVEKSAPLKPIVHLDFERQFKVGYLMAVRDPDKVEYLYWLAWDALKRDGQVVKPFDDWVAELDDLPTFTAAPKDGAGPL